MTEFIGSVEHPDFRMVLNISYWEQQQSRSILSHLLKGFLDQDNGAKQEQGGPSILSSRALLLLAMFFLSMKALLEDVSHPVPNLVCFGSRWSGGERVRS